MDNRELFENGASSTSPPTEPIRDDWYVDLTREEYVAFRMLHARVSGPLRTRVVMIILPLLCCVMSLAIALEEWHLADFAGYPDPVLLAAAVLVLLPMFYAPAAVKEPHTAIAMVLLPGVARAIISLVVTTLAVAYVKQYSSIKKVMME